MKKKTIVKIILDVLMILVISLMYSKQALGIAFHEIGGLILIGVFFIHKGLNFEWIRRVTVKFAKADGKTRVMWIVDALMLVAFLAVGLSGILISKVAFPGLTVQGGPWKTIHYSCAALSLILVGVHLGLHFNYLKGIFSRWIKLPRVVAVALTVVLMAYGAYGVATTSFARWLAMPFSTSQQGGEGGRGGQFPGAESQSSGETASTDAAAAQTDASFQTLDASAQTADAAAAQTTSDTAAAQTDASFQTLDVSAQTADSTTATSGDTANSASASEGQRSGGPGGHGGQSGSVGSALQTLAQFFSIAFLFAALTALADRALREGRRQKAS